jgi:murein L,D-transpeptidase YcbB/YkuD
MRCGLLHRTLPVVLISLLASACGNTSSESRTDADGAAIVRQQVIDFVDEFVAALPERASDAVATGVREAAPGEILEAQLVAYDPMVQQLVRSVYEARDGRAVFLAPDGLTADGRAVADLLATAPRHALESNTFRLAEIAARRDAVDALAAADAPAPSVSVEDHAILLAYLVERAELGNDLPASDAVFRLIAETSGENPLPAFAEAVDRDRARLTEARRARPELDVLLVAGWFIWARAQHFDNLNTVEPTEAEASGWDLESADQHEQIVQQRLAAAFADAASRTGGLSEALQNAIPPQLQYARLIDGLAEYSGYVAAGGWEPIPAVGELRVGSSHEGVPALRARLAAENYFDGDLQGEVYDEAVRAAVLDYQERHQLSDTGVVDEDTLTSLNVSAERRLAQIIVTMNRWRQSRSIRDYGQEHIWVNVPDFHGELWDNNEVVRRWRVITGSRMNVRGPDGEMRVRGRTPLFSDTMLYIVFNPYWNVPDSIFTGEYEEQILANPNWPAENGYELITEPNGRQWLRQLPGDSNSLGHVKFLFPNEHDVYMHDTPNRRLFDHTIRAFSHGCIRTHEPIELAELLVARDRGYTEGQAARFVRDMLELDTEEWFSLRRPIPVHIEYFSVRGDDDGRMNFLADIYRYDADETDRYEAAIRALWGRSEHGPEVDAEVEAVVPANAGW